MDDMSNAKQVRRSNAYELHGDDDGDGIRGVHCNTVEEM
jgi:hypothetical protein